MPLYFKDIIVVCDNGVGGKKYRGAQVWSVGADTLTVRLLLEANIVSGVGAGAAAGDRVVSKSLSPHSAIGDAKCAEITGSGADDYVVGALHDASFANVTGGNDSVAAGRFEPGAIDAGLSGQPKRLHWASGMMSERSWRG